MKPNPKKYLARLAGLIFMSLVLFSAFRALRPADILALKYANMLHLEDVEHHVHALAADSLEGRLTGTEGCDKAADYIARYFSQIILEPVYESGYFQSFDIVTPNMPNVYIATDRQQYQIGVDFLSFFPHDSARIAANEIVYVGYGIKDPMWDDYAYRDVKGKIVLVKAGEPRDNFGASLITSSYRKSKWSADPVHAYMLKRKAALESGAKAMLYYDPEHYEAFREAFERMYRVTRKTSEIQVDSLYDFIISTRLMQDISARESLDSVYYTGRRDRVWHVPVRIGFHTQDEILSSQNVMGIIRGEEEPGEYILVTANYDHLGKIKETVYPGANLNATGTGAVMEIARLFRIAEQDGYVPKRSIVFILFTGREQDHLGAKYFLKHPPFSTKKIKAVVDIDMIGFVDTVSTYPNNIFIAQELKRKKFLSYLKTANKAGPKLTIRHLEPAKRFENMEAAPDVILFYQKKIPWISFVNGKYPFFKTPDDTPDKITWDIYTERTKFIFMAVWKLANE
ncbi:MAG: M28 family peptidase [Chlorobi bacterium]|nr:M28 family peptidase [Chlorobiota bacterium]